MFPGIEITGASTPDRALTLLLVAVLFGVVNTFIRPVVALLALPLYLLTLGLMFFVVNALMLILTSWLAGKLSGARLGMCSANEVRNGSVSGP